MRNIGSHSYDSPIIRSVKVTLLFLRTVFLLPHMEETESIPFTNLLCYDDAVDAFQQRQSQNYVDDTEMLEIKLLYQHTESDPR